MIKRNLAFFMVTILLFSHLSTGFIEASVTSVEITATIRDFKADFKLFEGALFETTGLVQNTLGSDRKPIFADPSNPSTPLTGWQSWAGTDENGNTVPITLSDLNSFFNDQAGYNMTATQKITMTKNIDGNYAIGTENTSFFPIDNQLFGNEEYEHNFHFSMEIHESFNYQGNETFSFSGDDDVWIFIDNQLVVDLGGVHSSQQVDISLPQLVASGKLNLKVGDVFNFDMFYMERHTSESNLTMVTNIDMSKYANASAWAIEELDQAAMLGFITNEIKSDMNSNITREEFAKTSVLFYEKVTGKVAEIAPSTTFKDTTDTNILKSYALGIVNGVGGGLFKPKDLLTREQMAKMIVCTLRAVKNPLNEDITGVPEFSDQKNIASWALEFTKYLYKYNITKGIGNGNFGPRDNCTREQAIAFLVRAYNLIPTLE